jgi:hypothetical protein
MRLVTLAILAAAGTIAAGAPAMAQPDHYGHGGYGDRGRGEGPRAMDLNGRIDWMQRRIDRGRDDGSLDRREVYRVQSALDGIRRDMRRMERRSGGVLRGYQRDELQGRLDRLNDQMHWLRRNDERRPW